MDFEELDRLAATNFARAARSAGARRIVYLGGLGAGDDLSPHLAGRHEVGEILRDPGVATTIELRASIVIGSGGASFETVRALVEGLPAIPAPRWVETAAQPIAIEDSVDYLFEALTLERSGSAIVEIGGADCVTYADVMREYARQRTLRRRVVPMPLITARVSRLFLGLLTPVYGRVAGAMMDSLRNETILHDTTGSTPLRSSHAAWLRRSSGRSSAKMRSSPDALADAPAPIVPSRWGGNPVKRRLVSSHMVRVRPGVEDAFIPTRRIGGPTGWYATDWFWRLRGLLDRARGGEGLRRGRCDVDELHVGDTIDFWRVERLEPGRCLLLAAEMKLPGGGTQLWQTTVFDPAGYVGLLYLYLLFPIHHGIFAAMLRGLRRATASGGHARSAKLG